MPSWKKVVASGSDASFSSLTVDTYVSASSFKGSFTGSLQGTSSWAVSSSNAISSSYALTASYALFAANGGGGGVSAIYILDEGVVQGTASYFDFTGAGVTATVNNQTASIYIPGGGCGSNTNSQNAILSQTSPAVTWSFTHNLSTLYPVFTIYDNEDNVIIPQKIHAETTASAFIYFSSARTGTAVASKGGDVVSASFSATASLAYFAISASQAATASSANTFNVRTSLTASGLRYPTADGIEDQFLSTDGAGTLSFTNVRTLYQNIRNMETSSIVKGTPLFASGSTGDNVNVYIADAINPLRMPATLIANDNTLVASAAGRGIILGHIEGVDTTGYTAGTEVYVGPGGSWTATRPTGSAIVQALGIVTREGSNGMGIVLTVPPTNLPNIAEGQAWVGNVDGTPIATATSSFSVANAVSASYAATSSYATNFTASNILVSGTITAQTLVVQTVTSSIAYSSGSNIFGNSTANTQTFTGSVNITGSLNLNGKATLTDLTGSLFGTASWAENALTASYVTTAQTASYVLNAVSSSYTYTASSAINSSASLTSISASYSYTASSATSASLAQTASYVVTAQTASYVENAISSSYAYTASSSVSSSYAYTASSATNASASLTSVSASYALTASYALNGGGGGVSAIYIQDEGTTQGTASYFNFTGAGVTATVTDSTASINITGGGSGISGLSTTFTQSVAEDTWTFVHNLNTRYPLIQVYDTTYNQVTPQYVSSSTADTVIIGFGVPVAGYAVASNGGTLYVTGSNVILDQAVAATTWSFNHNLNTQYPIFQVFDSTNEVVVPQRIVATDATSSLIYFPSPVAGKAVASVGGISGSMGSGVGFPFSGSAVITGSFLVSQSFVDFSKSTGVSGSFTGSLYGTSSYATFALSCSFAPGFTTNMSQSAAATTWSFTHNLNTITPIVQVYDLTNAQIIPNQIVGMNNSTAEIRFDYAQAGYAVASNGGGLYVTGSTSTLVQTVGAVTWSFTHNLNNKYNTYEVYDSNDYVLIPSAIKAVDNNNVELHFATSQTGRAVAQFSGINGAPNATTASYALTATSASYAATASYLNPITNSYVVLTQVSQSLNFVDDVAAAAGGVPLGGIYRNGNFILIRLS